MEFGAVQACGDARGEEAVSAEVQEERYPEDATRYRRAAARITYMAQDRADLAFAAKELAKNMARPRKGDEVKVKRVIRYLRAKPRAYVEYPWQDRPIHLNVYTQTGQGM